MMSSSSLADRISWPAARFGLDGGDDAQLQIVAGQLQLAILRLEQDAFQRREPADLAQAARATIGNCFDQKDPFRR